MTSPVLSNACKSRSKFYSETLIEISAWSPEKIARACRLYEYLQAVNVDVWLPVGVVAERMGAKNENITREISRMREADPTLKVNFVSRDRAVGINKPIEEGPLAGRFENYSATHGQQLKKKIEKQEAKRKREERKDNGDLDDDEGSLGDRDESVSVVGKGKEVVKAEDESVSTEGKGQTTGKAGKTSKTSGVKRKQPSVDDGGQRSSEDKSVSGQKKVKVNETVTATINAAGNEDNTSATATTVKDNTGTAAKSAEGDNPETGDKVDPDAAVAQVKEALEVVMSLLKVALRLLETRTSPQAL